MKLEINTPLNSYSVSTGDIILTSSKVMLVVEILMNDYRYALVDLASAKVISVMKSLDPMEKVNDEIIMKIVKNTESKLTLP